MSINKNLLLLFILVTLTSAHTTSPASTTDPARRSSDDSASTSKIDSVESQLRKALQKITPELKEGLAMNIVLEKAMIYHKRGLSITGAAEAATEDMVNPAIREAAASAYSRTIASLLPGDGTTRGYKVTAYFPGTYSPQGRQDDTRDRLRAKIAARAAAREARSGHGEGGSGHGDGV